MPPQGRGTPGTGPARDRAAEIDAAIAGVTGTGRVTVGTGETSRRVCFEHAPPPGAAEGWLPVTGREGELTAAGDSLRVGAAVVVGPDQGEEAALSWAAGRIATFGMYQAGQSCISVQRVFAHRDIADALAKRVVEAVEGLPTGDPTDPSTDVGPLIDEAAARRVESWVDEAVAAGAQVFTGGSREGATYAPTVLTDVPADAKVSCEEVFGPVLVLEPVDSVDEAFERVNDSRFGLQAGVFTGDLKVAFQAARALDVGG